jgi:hypothetical protein
VRDLYARRDSCTADSDSRPWRDVREPVDMTFSWQQTTGSPPAAHTARSAFQQWSSTPQPDAATVELLPDRLTLVAVAVAVAVAVLGVDDVGIAIINTQVRVPLGASSAPPALAEQLQFTVGEGPCLAALQASAATSIGKPRQHPYELRHTATSLATVSGERFCRL